MPDDPKLQRRAFFRGAATIAAAAAAATVIPIKVARAQKASKESLKYQDTPKNGQECDACVYWQPPKSCVLVEGDISPKGWCTAFNPKSQKK